MRRTLLCAAILAAALPLHAAPARAQAPPTTLATQRGAVTARLEAATQTKAGEGYRVDRAVDDATVIGKLGRAGSVVLELRLREGVQYWIPAGCDGGCDDLDLRVHSPEGELLDEDVEADAVPVVSFTAPESGLFLLTVTMSSCKAELCYFGFRVLARQ
ncbi:MAG TPA: hypothetical protein VF746_04925 [Longimicrobium sp.]|jgi:hypothetical protein